MNNKENFNTKDKQQPVLLPKAVYGISTELPNNIIYFAADKFAFLAGNYIVISTIKEKKQYFFPVNAEYGQVTCFDVEENKEKDYIMIAFAQKAEKSAIFVKFVHKYDFSLEESKSKRLMIDDIHPDDSFVALAINKGYIITYIGYKNDKILIFHNSSQSIKFVTAETSNDKSIIFNNLCVNTLAQSNFFCLYGDNGFCTYFLDQEKKEIVRGEPNQTGQQQAKEKRLTRHYKSACWISQTRLALLTLGSDVLILEYMKGFDHPFSQFIKFENIFGTELKTKIIFSKDLYLYCIREDGLVCKLEDRPGRDRFHYEKDNNSPKFVSNLPRMEVFYASLTSHMHSIGGAYGLLMSTTDNQIYHIDIQSDIAFFDGSNYKDLYGFKFHNKEITCIDVAKQKALIATCSKDKYIKIWNFISLNLEVEQLFDEEPKKLAFHPNGLNLAVIFMDKICMMNILERKIEIYKEIIIPNPLDVKFSNFGSFFSVCSKNGFKIYNFYTNDLVRFQFLSHGHSDNVTDLVWDTEDIGFATCGADGKAFYWSLLKRDDNEKVIVYT